MLSGLSYSFDRKLIDRDKLIEWITSSSWGHSRRPVDIDVAFDNSVACGAYLDFEQIAVIRVVTDRRFFAYIADLYVADTHRGKGIGAGLIAAIMNHRDCVYVQNWLVTSTDAAGYFRKRGFRSINGERNLVARRQDILPT